MSRTKIDFGIDLGTTNSAIVRMENGEPKIQKTDTLKDTMPSCVSFNRRKSISAGDAAFNQFRRDKLIAMKGGQSALNSFIEFKRTMGLDKVYFSSNMDKSYTSEDLSSEILKTLKSFVSDEEISSVVITVPAKFNTTQIDATQKAAELAGFSYVELLQEPIAAAMAYGLNPTKSDGYWFVYDFGGGTFDAAIIKVDDGIMKVVDTEGDNHLGGKDVDLAIVDKIIIPELQKEYDIESILGDENKKNILRDAMKSLAEEAKIKLSRYESHDVLTEEGDIPGTDDNGETFELDFTITREDFKNAVSPVFQQSIDICKELMMRNNLTGDNISSLILVGGPTYSPVLRDMLKSQVSSNINTTIDPMTAVAAGAALYASTRDIPNNLQKRDTAKVQLDLKYESTTVELEEYVTVKVLRDKTTGSIPDSLFFELIRSDKAWSSGKTEIIGDAELIEVQLQENKANGFDVFVCDEKGNSFQCEPSKITIIQGISQSSGGMATLPYNIGVEIKDLTTGKIGLNTVNGLERNNSIPASGKGSYKTQIPIRPGNPEDKLIITILEGENGSEGTKAIHTTLIKEVVITGEDVQKLLPAGSEIELTLKIDSSRRIKFEAFFPYLDVTKELEIDRNVLTVISPERLDSEISRAKNQIQLLSNESSSINASMAQTIEQELENLQNMLDSGRGDEDNRDKVKTKLCKTLKKIDSVEEAAEWPNVAEELNDALVRLDENNERYGNEKTEELVYQFKQQATNVISIKDINVAKELIEQIRSLNFALLDEGAGVAMEISLIKGMDEEFDVHEWSNRTQARNLINEAKQIISSNPTKSNLRPIVIQLYKLLPEVAPNDGGGGQNIPGGNQKPLR